MATPEEILAEALGSTPAPAQSRATSRATSRASGDDILAGFLTEQRGQGKRGTMTAPPVEKSKLSLREQVEGGLRGVGQGMTLNAADEIASGMATLGHKAENFITGGNDDRGWGEVYDATMSESKNRREAFAEAEPTIDLTSNVGGAFATGGLTGAQLLSTQAVKNAPKLLKALAASTVGAGEGVVAGFNSGDSYEDRVDRAKTGGMFGAAIPAALSGAGALTRGVSNKYKMDKPLEVLDGKQMPLNLADNGWRGTIYRDVVNNSFGGGKLGDDAAPFIQRVEDGVTSAKTALTNTVEASKNTFKNSVDRIKLSASNAANDVDVKLRQDVTATSLPNKLSDNAKQMLAQSDNTPQQVAKLLKKEWRDNGFDMINSKYFDLDDATFKKEMTGLFDKKPSLNTVAGDYMTAFNKSYDDLIDEGTGQISGKNFMELRNIYARDANLASDPNQAMIFRTIATKIDDLILDNLPSADKAAFRAEKTAYDSFDNLLNATGKAKKKGGYYTGTEWLSSTSNHRAATGSGPQQEIADKALRDQAEIKAGISKQIEALPDKANADAAKKVKEVGLTQAKKARQDLNERMPANSNLWNKLLSTKMLDPTKVMRSIALGVGGTAVGGPFAGIGAMAGGAALARALASNPAQRAISGQSVDQLLTKGRDAKVGGLSLADILRQGTTTGAIQGQNE